MDASATLLQQGHRLIQLGVALLLFVSFEGFAIPYFVVPRLGLSVHTLSALLGALFPTMGLIWPRLDLGPKSSRLAFGSLVYSGVAIVVAYLLAGIWGAGNSTLPISAGPAHGSSVQETAIAIIAYSSAPTGIFSFGLVFWGLRGPTAKAAA